MLGNAVVQHAFSVDDFMLLCIESGCVIFEELDERTGFRAFIKNLGLALVNTAATVHGFSRISIFMVIGCKPLFSRATYSNYGLLTILLCARSPVFGISDVSLCMSRKKVVLKLLY